MKVSCPVCDTEFTCSPEGTCWCTELPPMPIMGPGTGDRCFCPNCLGKRLKNYEALAEADLGKR